MTVVADPNAAAPQTTTPATPAAAPPAAQQAAAPPAGAPEGQAGQDPNWLSGRITQAKKNAEADMLKALGVSNVSEAQAAIAAAKATADANKTAEQRAADLKLELEQQKVTSSAQSKVITEYAARQMIVLTEEQKAAVLAIAGEDAGKQLQTIAALQPTWSKNESAQAAAQQAGQPAGQVAPQNSAPGRAAPSGATGSPPDQKAVYAETKKTNPFAAANHGLRHSDEVYKPQQQ